MRQAIEAGEINVPMRKGLFSQREIYGTLGEIIAGMKPGRKDDKAITVFDSTGLAIQDIATARVVYEKARKRGEYLSLDLA